MLHSFSWLLRENPDCAATILKANGGDRTAAAANWRSLQREIKHKARTAAILAERARCAAHGKLLLLTGDIDLAISAVDSGATVEDMHEQYLQAASESGRPFAVALTAAHLAKRQESSPS